MAGAMHVLRFGLAGSLALGCVADPVTRRDDDPLDAGNADAAVVALALALDYAPAVTGRAAAK